MSEKLDWYPIEEVRALHTSNAPLGCWELDVVVSAKTVAQAVDRVMLTPLGFVRYFRVLRISSKKNPHAPTETVLEVALRVYVDPDEQNPLRAPSSVETLQEASRLLEDSANALRNNRHYDGDKLEERCRQSSRRLAQLAMWRAWELRKQAREEEAESGDKPK